MAIKTVYLVIGPDQKVRAAVRPQIRANEVAIAVRLKFPDTWGRIVSTINVDVPDFAPDVDEPGGAT